MYKELSKTKKITKRLKALGKIRIMDTKEDIDKILQMNKYMEEVSREYIYKSTMSERSAAKIILNS